MIRSMKELLVEARKKEPKRLAVACAQDAHVLEAVKLAYEEKIIKPVLVGDEEKIRGLMAEVGLMADEVRIINEPDKTEACMKTAGLIRDGEADVIMKGMVDTAIIMRAILAQENGLRGKNKISHDLLLEIKGFDRLFHVTDSAMTVAPGLEDKAAIIENAVKVAHALGNENPKVAVLCAVEKVNPKMQCTVEAQALKEMNQRGELTGCVVEGPLQLDNAVSEEAAKQKGISSEVAGKADILVAPDIEAGNVLNKAMEYFAHAKKAGVIVGAKVPVALTSRATSAESKLYTIALACLAADQKEV